MPRFLSFLVLVSLLLPAGAVAETGPHLVGLAPFVRKTWRGALGKDGRMHSTSEYLKVGQWQTGHEAWYLQAQEAKMMFR